MSLVDAVLVRAPWQDLLRLVVLPVFAWAAYRDVRTRRVPNRTWIPLVALGVVLLAADAYGAVRGGYVGSFALRTAISLLVVIPLAYAFWLFGGFGGADFKAIATLAVLLPTYPVYLLPAAATDLGLPGSMPVVRSNIGVFSFTVLTNAVLFGASYPLWVGLRNALGGRFAPAMFVGKPVALDRLPVAYGSLLGGRLGLRRGLDLDALRMYLRWRDATLPALLGAPATHRDPASVPAETLHPGDGAVGERERRVVEDGPGTVGTGGPAGGEDRPGTGGVSGTEERRGTGDGPGAGVEADPAGGGPGPTDDPEASAEVTVDGPAADAREAGADTEAVTGRTGEDPAARAGGTDSDPETGAGDAGADPQARAGGATNGPEAGGGDVEGAGDVEDAGGPPADPWGADRFVAEVGEPYGTGAEDLREGLETLVEAHDGDGDGTVWVTPGTPFIVPLFFGLLAAFTVGDVLFAALVAAGLVPGATL